MRYRVVWYVLGAVGGAVVRCAQRRAVQRVVRGKQRQRPCTKGVERHPGEREAPVCPGWAPQGLAPAARQEGAPQSHAQDRTAKAGGLRQGWRRVPVEEPYQRESM